MRYGWLLAAPLLGTACGDNNLPVGAAVVHGRDLAIVAHAEDDLVFMQPDLLERTRRGGTLNLYVTDGSTAADARHLGLMQAYSASTGLDGWRCGWIDLAGHFAEHCRLADAHLSLVFLGLPEGDSDGTSPTSLPKLWSGELDVAITVGDKQAIYTRQDVVDVIAAVVNLVEPDTIRTLDIAHVHGRDHADHVVTGAAGLVAIAASKSSAEVIAFRGESTTTEAPNVIEPLFARSAEILGRFEACAKGCAACGEVCHIVDERATWMRRRYAVSLRRPASGTLRAGAECITADADGLLAVGACTDAWRIAIDGTLRIGDRCVSLDGDELRAGDSCTRFFFDDEGHLWIGVPPPATTGGPLQCVALEAGRPRAKRCGIELAPVWELSPAPTATPRPVGLVGTGRAVRLADLDGDRRADLCEITNNRLACALGDGVGGFAASKVIRVFPVEPESLVIGDVDGDGLPDACGRDSGGISCAVAATGFMSQRWSPAFARTGPANASDRSLAAVDADDDGSADVCGLTVSGVVCAAHAPSAFPEIRSTWPVTASTLWPADLDGDRHADWCVATPAGAACSLDHHRDLTTDGVPWSFSQDGIVDAAPDAITGALADIDGDGRADLCSLRDARITCARSQDYGFGPSATLATFPTGATPTALWLGDLDGDRIADACVDDAGTIRCVRSR